MPVEMRPGKPTTRRYSKDEKDRAVRLVRQLRVETGEGRGACIRVARQLGYGPESVRRWVVAADVDDGHKPGRTSDDAARINELEQKVVELERANEILTRRMIVSLSIPIVHRSCPWFQSGPGLLQQGVTGPGRVRIADS